MSASRLVTDPRVLASLAALMAAACQVSVSQRTGQVVTGGEVCAAGERCQLACRSPERCTSFEFERLSDPASSTQTSYVIWWVNPSSGASPDAVPIYFIPGLGLYGGYNELLWGAEAIADTLHRPIAVLTTQVHGTQAEVQQFDAWGDLAGVHLDSAMFAGAHYRSRTWSPHYPPVREFTYDPVTGRCSGGMKVKDRTQYRCVDCAGGFWESVGTGKGDETAFACYKDLRAARSFRLSAPEAIVLGWSRLVARGVVTDARRFDVLTHSAGGVRVTGAIVNDMGIADERFNSFWQKVRAVVSVNTPFAGVVDLGNVGIDDNDAREFGNRLTSSLVERFRDSPKLANVHWWALASKAPNRSGSFDAGYLGGRYAKARGLTEYCGRRDTVDGDGVVPFHSQFSPWRNSHGDFVRDSDACGNPGRYVARVALTGSTETYNRAKGLGRRGDHAWYLSTPEGNAQILRVLAEVCDHFGGNCAGAPGETCYTGPAATLNQGTCHAGFRYPGETTCRDQKVPTAEVCNGLDDDCDGIIDDDRDVLAVAYVDDDGDGYGTTAATVPFGCGEPRPGYAKVRGDCDDNDPNVNKGEWRFRKLETSAGGFDFDCDGRQEREEPKLAPCSGISVLSDQAGWVSSVPACGETGKWLDCRDLSVTTRVQRCR